MVQVDAGSNLIVCAMEGNPVDIESKVMREVNAKISLGSDTIEGVFEFELMNVNRYVFASKMV
jgi:hypothetical protein